MRIGIRLDRTACLVGRRRDTRLLPRRDSRLGAQRVGAGVRQLLSRAESIGDANGADAVRLRAYDVVFAITDHHRTRRIDLSLFDDVAEQIALVAQ